MAATRLSEGQKSELVDRFRGGASTTELAKAYGCSPNTVIRTVRGALEPQEYERLKRQRGRAAAASDGKRPPEQQVGEERGADGDFGMDAEDLEDDGSPSRILAIDDADDFSADEEEDDEDLLEEDEGEEGDVFTTVPVVAAAAERTAIEATPLQEARLPTSAYMLVDKTVELQARPLRDFPELGSLTAAEEERQALTVYLNPRQAKRQCGRSQRVIKLPDLRVLERTAPYLLAQGISRVVIEGSLYSLPGS
jgi:transposase-like protein